MKRRRKAGPEFPVWQELADRIRERMTKLGWSQKRLAEEIGVNQATVSHVLTLKHPTSAYVVPICKALGIPYPLIQARDPQIPRAVKDLDDIRDRDPELFRRLIQEISELADATRRSRKDED